MGSDFGKSTHKDNNNNEAKTTNNLGETSKERQQVLLGVGDLNASVSLFSSI